VDDEPCHRVANSENVMDRAGVKGKQATSKGLRHGFGIAILSAEKA